MVRSFAHAICTLTALVVALPAAENPMVKDLKQEVETLKKQKSTTIKSIPATGAPIVE